MSEESTVVGARVDAQVYARFREYVQDAHGKVRGELGRELENAMVEYMDNDRYDRIESNQEEMLERLDTLAGVVCEGDGTHTHKADASPTTVTEKADLIASKLREEGGDTVPGTAVDAAIREVAGGDDRTIRKYRKQLRLNQSAYAHPASASDVWFLDAGIWASAVENYVDNTPDADLLDILQQYSLTIEEYEQLLAPRAAV